MNKLKQAQAGTLESNDIAITVGPAADGGIVIELQSLVMEQYGDQIWKVIRDTVIEQGVSGIILRPLTEERWTAP